MAPQTVLGNGPFSLRGCGECGNACAKARHRDQRKNGRRSRQPLRAGMGTADRRRVPTGHCAEEELVGGLTHRC